MINIWIVFSLTITLIVLCLLLFYVLPIEIRELRRPEKRKVVRVIQYVMLSVTLSMLLFSIVPVSYQITRLDASGMLSFQNVASLSSSLRLLSFSMGWIAIHAVANLAGIISFKKEK